MEYTAVGRGINLASRLEASCTPGRIKVSYPVYLLTKDRFDYEETVEESFKGFARKIRVCELAPGWLPRREIDLSISLLSCLRRLANIKFIITSAEIIK